MKSRHQNSILQTIAIFIAAGGGFLLLSMNIKNINDSSPKEKYTSIETHIDNKKLEAEIRGTGGAQENCIELDLTNATADTLSVRLEPGRRLVSRDTTVQDILIVKERKQVLNPSANQKIAGYGFCCQSHKGGPDTSTKYGIGRMAPESWQNLITEINKHDFPVSAVQDAIWCLSNDKPISSIHHDDLDSIKTLRGIVADIKGEKIPWYSVTYEEDTTMVTTNKPENVHGKLDYYLTNNAKVTINVTDKHGRLIRTLVKEKPLGQGEYTYHLQLDVKDWPEGKYRVFVYANRTVKKRKTFEL